MAITPTWRATRLSLLSLLVGSSISVAQLTTPVQLSPSSSSSGVAVSGTASSTRNPITHTIQAGKGGNTFVPDVVQADVGDTIEFDFYPTNHSVARAEYQYPCIPYELTGVDKVGFFSGFEPVDAILADPPKFTIRVNDTLPIFYYCTAPGSCINFQMVGVINPNASVSLATQKQDAKDSTFMLVPGENWPPESEPTQFISSSAPSKTSASAGSTSTASADHGHPALSAGAIAGIAIGGAAVLVLAAALIYMCGRQSRNNNKAAVPPPHDDMGRAATFMQQQDSMNKIVPNVTYMPQSPYQDSFHSGPYSPPLPGYVPHHDQQMATPMRPYYAGSDALSPANDVGMIRTPSPNQMGGVPAYTTSPQLGYQQSLQHSQEPVHEMYAPSESQNEKQGAERYQ